MDNYICINGKKAELTEEQIKALGIELPKTPFSRTAVGGEYFYISPDGNIFMEFDRHGTASGKYFDVANYCTDKVIMKQRAMHEILSRQLWRFSEQNGGSGQFSIARGDSGKLRVMGCAHKYLDPSFKSEKIANRAIAEIIKPFMEAHPDFVW